MKKDLKGHRLTPEKQRKVTENMRLVYFLIKRYFHVSRNSPEYEELESEGYIGLVKAALNFDETKNISFGTFASRCINNEIRMYFRKNNKYQRDEYLENYINLGGENDLTIKDTIGDTRCNIEEEVLFKELIVNELDIILNCLKPRALIVLLYRIANLQQRCIAEIFNLQRPSIYKIEKRSLEEVRRITENGEKYTRIFSISKEDESYYIQFLAKDIENWEIVWKELQIKTENLYGVHIKYQKGKITIRVCMGDFLSMAKIFSIILQTP